MSTSIKTVSVGLARLDFALSAETLTCWRWVVLLLPYTIVVPFWGSYLESYKVVPKRNYYRAQGQGIAGAAWGSKRAVDKLLVAGGQEE